MRNDYFFLLHLKIRELFAPVVFRVKRNGSLLYKNWLLHFTVPGCELLFPWLLKASRVAEAISCNKNYETGGKT